MVGGLWLQGDVHTTTVPVCEGGGGGCGGLCVLVGVACTPHRTHLIDRQRCECECACECECECECVCVCELRFVCVRVLGVGRTRHLHCLCHALHG